MIQDNNESRKANQSLNSCDIDNFTDLQRVENLSFVATDGVAKVGFRNEQSEGNEDLNGVYVQ